MPTDFTFDRALEAPPRDVEFLGLRFALTSRLDQLDALSGRGADRPFSYVITPNVDHVVRLASEPADSTIRAAYDNAAVRLCDSRVVSRLGWLLGVQIPVVTGSDLTAQLLAHPGARRRRVAVIGANEAVIAKLRDLYPDTEFVHHAPPMGLLQNPAAMAEAAQFGARARADILLLAVGSPQQELLAHQIQLRGDAIGTGLCIGASIDFVTGRERRAPKFVQWMGFEWAFRLLVHPRRMWRRYLVRGPRIFGLAWTWYRERAHSGR